MVAYPILLVGLATRELALFAACGFLAGGLDDLFIDLIWLGRSAWRSLVVYRRHRRVCATTITAPEEPGRLAIFVAAWREEAVIGGMVSTALARLRHPDWRLYVGCYPNDPGTIAAVERASGGDPRVRIVIGDEPGGTTKAGCLNWIWQAMLGDERAEGARFKAVILHDAEDVVHPDELTVYDALIGRFDLVQLPVHAVTVRGAGSFAALISSHYCGEFSEAHSKQVVVREAVGAAVPSAGVGCAIERGMLAAIAEGRDGPFDPRSLTEDYELGLRIGALGGRGVFVRLPAGDGRGIVAVRACFPHSVVGAVRQKSRWLTGIALAGWDRLGWSGGLAERWMRLRDRRAPLAALVLTCGYAALAGWAATHLAARMLGTEAPRPAIPMPLLLANLGLLGWRIGIRFTITARSHGWRMAALTPLHMVIGNLVAIAAAVRAFGLYSGLVRHGRLRWDKTAHVLPLGEDLA
ncbi:glycosyl transferase family protein [Sphingomonas oligoaromativorans]|uniref:glycosyl transferase family protein n=1 Tax=Sphingomonas oligoaromativorans TaxID=575322 RepID=UPI0014222F10|nr:glycosyl transferase family protein [Sphingomonas oligoaromativorans]NIJ34532.1 adsorption protein B [Sphingomonas oligoaromativorans]